MPMYFFRVRNEDGNMFDEGGAEFADEKNASREAMQTACDMAAAKMINGDILEGIHFEITRADGSLMKTIPLKSLVDALISD